MEQKKFNVLLYDNHKIVHYNVLPYFRREWEEKPCIWDKDYKEISVKTRDDLKKWVKDRSQYQYWSRCEYEFLMGSWPFGRRKTTEGIKEFMKKNLDLDDYKNHIDFYNIITDEMDKIDVHEQIMMNLDIIVDILYEEFLNNKK